MDATWERIITDLGSSADDELVARVKAYAYGAPPDRLDLVAMPKIWGHALDLAWYAKKQMDEATGTARASELMGVYVCAREAVIRLHRIIKAK